MPKLHELLAVQDSLRSQAEATRADLKNTFEKKRTHFSEKVVTYKSLTEGVEDKVESQLGLQTTVSKELQWIADKLGKAIDISHQVDEANTLARADVVLDDGTVLLKGVPATSLLQLGHRIKEVQDLVTAIPTLDPAQGFREDKGRGDGIYQARDVEKPRTEKKWEVLTLAVATDKHPAQVEKMAVDRVIGHTIQQEWSSLITVSEKGDMLDRCEEFSRAVKRARSKANDFSVDTSLNKIGETVLEYLFKVKVKA